MINTEMWKDVYNEIKGWVMKFFIILFLTLKQLFNDMKCELNDMYWW